MAMELPLAGLPATLGETVARHWQTLQDKAAAQGMELPQEPALAGEIARVWGASEFVATACAREPALLQDLLASGDLSRVYEEDTYACRLRERLADVADEDDLARRLRRFRRREMVRIAWRDLAYRAALEETLADLSNLADAAVAETLACLHRWQCAELGIPFGADSGEPQELVVIAMGKLGGGELNFSSDIDLIFAYPEDGETRDGRRPGLSNEEYFARLARRLVQALSTVTDEGAVFRVDLRLRPFGESAPLALSFDATEEYYQSHGREWERYAWIKGRPVGGDLTAGQQLMERLRPFVYRRYLDYGAFEALRDMKTRINQEVRRKGRQADIKLGPGGIREVEFIVQAFQLIRGGRQPNLQERHLLTVLPRLVEAGYLPEYVGQDLLAAYRFLRSTENRLQAQADRQTQRLPDDRLGRERLALAMGLQDWGELEAQLDHYRGAVRSHFEQVFEAPQAEASAGEEEAWGAVWQGTVEAERAAEVLTAAGFQAPQDVLERLNQLREGPSGRSLTAQGRQRLDQLMPLVLGAVAGTDHPDATLKRVLGLLERIARRMAYLALLLENPMALSQLVKLCAASPWVAGLLTRTPVLLDELLDPRSLYEPLAQDDLAQALDTALAQLPEDDLEGQMEALRHFKETNVLRVAAADVAGVYPLMAISDHLTAIAEVILQRVVQLARVHLVVRHGEPQADDGVPGFAVIGYGKLGGIELGYGSDLDIVFLHDSEQEGAQTRGPQPVDNAVFFARLAQRIVHILSARTPAGVLYEVDLRLRPSGSAGLVVSSLTAFAEYQRSDAWTWERQALVRARPVAGDAGVCRGFDAIRQEVLCQPRDPQDLQRQVREMRHRMRSGLSKARAGQFDIKQDPGGIADIEFMVQYGALRWAHDHPSLVHYTDNIRLLAGLAEAGLMPQADADALSQTYRDYRARVHQLTLQEAPALVPEAEFAAERALVSRLWAVWMEAGQAASQ